MSKYAELDGLILAKINNDTPTPFDKIHFDEDSIGVADGKIFTLCESFSTNQGEGLRVLDRRLQALRKAGKIKSIPGKGWVKLIEEEAK